MNKIKLIKTVSIIWAVIFIIIAVIIIFNPPIICWDGLNQNTGQMIGGCNPDYTLTVGLLCVPFAIWFTVQSIMLIVYFMIKKRIHSRK